MKRWSVTTYDRQGRVVGVDNDVDHRDAVAAIYEAMHGRTSTGATVTDRQPIELGHRESAPALSHAA